MDQEQEKPKVLFLRKAMDAAQNAQGAGPWDSFAKALKAFCYLVERDEDGSSLQNLATISDEFDHVFLDFDLTPWAALAKKHFPKISLVRAESFPWNLEETSPEAHAALIQHSCLVLDGVTPSDLVRLLHLYLLPKRMAGVAPLMEKGSVIVGEKLLTLDNLGRLLDSLSAYLVQLGNFELHERIPDLRLVLSALVFEAYRCAQKAQSIYPSVDFQVAASAKKLAINLRFAKNGLESSALPRLALAGEDLFWQQAWRSSDTLLITDHLAHNEVEVMILMVNAERRPPASFRSFLFKATHASARKENYLEPPQNYTFKILSEIRPKENDILLFEGNQKTEDIDLGGLPESVLKRLAKLTEQVAFHEDQARRKDAQLQEALAKAQATNKELGAKRSELIRIVKVKENEAEASKRQITQLTEEIEALKKNVQANSAAKEQNSAVGLQDAIAKMEMSLKASENEKNQLKENAANEQRKVSILEQKYSTLYKDIMAKDKEINDLKATVLKLRKDQTTEAPKAVSTGVSDTAAKLKEVEARESVLKQELRKVAFKVESQEKNIKVIQAEAVDKAKLMEQKLQEAKTKEVELLKKIEDLTAALKKATKAA